MYKSSYTRIIIRINPILNHIDTTTISPSYEDSYMVYKTQTASKTKENIKYPSHSRIKRKQIKDEILIVEDDRFHVSASGDL